MDWGVLKEIIPRISGNIESIKQTLRKKPKELYLKNS